MQKRIACLAVPLAVDRLSALLTHSNINPFGTLNKPLLSPRAGCFRSCGRFCLSWWGLPLIWKYRGNQIGRIWPFTASSSFLILYGRSLSFNMAQYLFSFIWLAILWLLNLNYDTPVLSDIQADGTSHAAISYERSLRDIWIFHLSVELTVGSLREQNRQRTGMTLARLCDCGVNPSC